MTARMWLDLGVEIPMRDGTVLRADVYRAADDRPLPTLVHHPYQGRRSKEGLAVLVNPVTAFDHGYATVLVDARGTGDSDGEWRPFAGHDADGYDTVEWCAAQPWCDGSVGVYGSSGMGVTALRTAIAAPPHLRAALLAFTGGTYHDGWAYTSGVLELSWSQWWARVMGAGRLARLPAGPERDALAERFAAARDPWPSARRLPLTGGPVPAELAPWFHEWLAHRTYDDHWARVDSAAQAHRIKVPVLQVGGYFDTFMPGHLAVSRALQSHPDPFVRDNSRNVLGPWTHTSYMSNRPTSTGSRDWGPAADSGWRTMTPLLLDWFDRWMKPPAPRPPAEPRVRYFVMGEGTWRTSAAWPPPSTPLTLYLRGGGSANGAHGDGTLSTVPPPPGEPRDTFRYDPLDPVPTRGGATLAPAELGGDGIQDQTPIEERPDVLVYTSPALPDPIRIAGPVTLTLYAASSAVDTDFTAKLVDVEPGGFAANVSEGIVRTRHRHGFDHDDLIDPGTPYELTIRLFDVAHSFAPGHRIRLEVSSSNFPRFARNLNTAVHPHDAGPDDAMTAVQQIFHDGDRPSCLTLPVLAEG